MSIHKNIEAAKKAYKENPSKENRDKLFIAGSALHAENGDYEAHFKALSEATKEENKGLNAILRYRILEEFKGWCLLRRPSHGNSINADGGINFGGMATKAKWFLKKYKLTTEEWYEISTGKSLDEKVLYIIERSYKN